VPPWRAAGATRVVIVSCALGSWVSPCFAFFAGFKRVFPSYLGALMAVPDRAVGSCVGRDLHWVPPGVGPTRLTVAQVDDKHF
jgi:hypothetical protein